MRHVREYNKNGFLKVILHNNVQLEMAPKRKNDFILALEKSVTYSLIPKNNKLIQNSDMQDK